MLAGILGTLVFGAGAIAADTTDSSSNPYQGVVVRNVFGLRDPPPPPDPDSIKPPVPTFYLTGITTIFGNKRALFRTAPAPAKTGKPVGKEESFMLTEGQRQGEVEVMHIDEVAGTVQVTYAGTVLTIDFTNNAAKAVAVAPPMGAPPGVPGLVPNPAIGARAPGAAQPGFRQPTVPGNVRRPIRTGGGLGMTPPPMGGRCSNADRHDRPAASCGHHSRATGSPHGSDAREQNNPGLPPLPPTSLTPLLDAANQEAAAKAASANPGYTAPGFVPPAPPGPPGRLY